VLNRDGGEGKCVSHFYCCWDQLSDSNLREERFILLTASEVPDHHGGEGVVASKKQSKDRKGTGQDISFKIPVGAETRTISIGIMTLE
jgi:hypothetical protein